MPSRKLKRPGCRTARRAFAAPASVFLAGALATSAACGAPGFGPHGIRPPGGLVQTVAVFGKDGRVSLPPQRRALQDSIGLLYEAGSHSVCTAFCVGDDQIATAAHCIFRMSGERAPKLSGFTFRLPSGRARGARIPSSRIAGTDNGSGAQHVVAGSTGLHVRPPIDAAHDWALARLAKPICKGARLAISRRPAEDLVKLSAGQRIYQVAFHRDFLNWQLAYDAPCPVRRTFKTADWAVISSTFTDAHNLILHTCDTGGASSGSPLLIDGKAGPEVVGMNVGTYVQSKVLIDNGKVVHRYQADPVANTGVATSAFLAQLDAFTGADILATRKSVHELQGLLADQGFYMGPRDGAYGPMLRSAIERFEQAEGRPKTGLATALVLKRLTVLKAAGTPPYGPVERVETRGLHEQAKAKADMPRP